MYPVSLKKAVILKVSLASNVKGGKLINLNSVSPNIVKFPIKNPAAVPLFHVILVVNTP